MFKKIVIFLSCQFMLNQLVYAGSAIDVARIVKENTDAVIAVILPKNPTADPEFSENSSIYPTEYVAGSGLIISEDGYIVTNYHVVENDGFIDDTIKVKFKNMQELPATLVGTDKANDVALLKINGVGLQAIKIGSSAALEIGQSVVAIGWPFGLGQSVTTGIVSGKGFVVPSKGNVPFIQTDTVLNEGNSGGPLLDAQGAVVGVNSWIYSNSGRYQGMSFAIPIDLVMGVVEKLKNSPKSFRSWMGIKTGDAAFFSPVNYGALILSFAPASPAKKAGLKEGDIVITFNQERVINSADLTHKVKNTPADSWVNFEIIRQGQRRAIKVKIGRHSKS